MTGGAGFIGSHLCDRLLAQGHQVTAVDDLSLGREENIAHLHGEQRFIFRREDILREEPMAAIFQAGRFDAVFHLVANSDIAASPGQVGRDFERTFLTTYRVLCLMSRNGVRELVFPSSSAVYGRAAGKLAEDSGPLQPISHYGAAKLASEGFISSFVENAGLRAWIARFPNVVGERATHGVIFDLIGKLRRDARQLEVLGDGAQEKPHLYVADLVDALLHIWTRSPAALNVFNIGVESRTTVKDLVRMVCQEMGLEPTVRYTGGAVGWVGDVPRYEYDLTRIHALGWKARRSSDEAVRLSIQRILAGLGRAGKARSGV